MKKVERISIGGSPYIIDVDAHELLSSYLKSLMRKYGNNYENELLHDIESRIAEIFNEKINPQNEVINIEMVRSVISQIGTVSSIEMDSMDTESGVRFNFDSPNEKSGSSEFKKVAQDGINIAQNVLSKTIKVILTIFIVLLIFKAIIIFISSLITLYYLGDLTIIPLYLVVFIPLFAILVILFVCSVMQRIIDSGRSFFSKKATILILFVMSLVSLAVAGVATIEIVAQNEFEQEVVEVTYVDIENIDEIVIDINERGASTHSWSINNISHFRKDGYILIEQDIDIDEDSLLKRVKIVVTKSSRGSSDSEAYNRAMALPAAFEIIGNKIHVNKYLKVSGKEIMYDADVEIEIIYPSDRVTLSREFSSW